MGKTVYLAMDLHARNFTLGQMNEHGFFKGTVDLPTSEKNIMVALKSVYAKRK